ncbi:MAG: ABC transporter ATP-binding protein [Erysipelotrichaceae bacterium]|nr:ABC transporter ATP-binding protein [Erysipelotrichaceae bacterium]
MDNAVIEFKNYSFKYHSQADYTLHDINLKIFKGEKILIVGPSGSGKSTLGNCINGLIPNSYKGEILGSLNIAGIDGSNASIFEISKEVGTVLQDSDGQFVGLSVAEDIAFALENDNVLQDEMKARVKQISKLVDMENFLKSNPYELSGGQKQRVSLAGVMVEDTKVLLFDEPLANLDPKTGKIAIELIDNIHNEDNIVIIIEHRLEDVLYKDVDRIILVDNGRIIIDDTPKIVLSSNILTKYGIREPLYISACRYADIEIKPEMNPENIDKFILGNEEKKLNDWFNKHNVRLKPNTNEAVLEINNLSFSYDGERKILDNINIDIKKGEMVSLVGKNGAGKSTLAKLIVRFEKLDQGDIKIKGESLLGLTIKETAKHVGIVLQNPNQMISKNLIYDEIAYGLRIRDYSEEDIKIKVDDVMKICGLSPFKNWPISALSYGQKKRVTIASILVLNPEILILDEPTAGQDYKHYSEIMEFLKTLNNNGQTIILITHDMHLMLEYTYRAIVLSDGKKLADKPSYEILSDNEIIEKANLKRTSLYDLAVKAHIKEPLHFIESFINYERRKFDEN